MKVTVESTQEEFDQKREELIFMLAGLTFGSHDLVKAMKERAKPVLRIQDDMMKYWDRKYKQMITEIKFDIENILGK